MIRSTYGQPTRPEQCIWILGLPVTKSDFYASQEREASDYTKRFWHWPDYCREFLDDYISLRNELITLGVRMFENAALDDFQRAWDENTDAVILFSHWSNDGIEFREGRASLNEIEAAIPITTVATLDLCVCHPQTLVRRLDASRRSLLTRSIWQEADPKFWCMFYKALFLLLSYGQLSYPDALDQVASEFGRRGR